MRVPRAAFQELEGAGLSSAFCTCSRTRELHLTRHAEGDAQGLTCLEQVLLLATAAHVRHTEARDDLQHWRLAPYVDAVLRQQRSCYAVQAAAVRARAQHEAERPRVRERALLAFQCLRDSLQVRAPGNCCVLQGVVSPRCLTSQKGHLRGTVCVATKAPRVLQQRHRVCRSKGTACVSTKARPHDWPGQGGEAQALCVQGCPYSERT